MGTHLRATGRHLPYDIMQCYLTPDTSEHAPPQLQPARPVLNLPTLPDLLDLPNWSRPVPYD